ncbi:hypothetical protein AB6G19_05695 [Providencia manganoxydans]
MYLSKIRSKHHLDLKMIFSVLFRAIFFPLFALWMLWKVNMASKKEILEDLARYREVSDSLSSSVLDISSKALEITMYIEQNIPKTEKNQELYQKIEQFVEVVMRGVANTNEYSIALGRDYGQAIKKIANSRGE